MLGQRHVRRVYLWHKWTGLITGLFIFFVSLTGSIAVFKHEIDRFLTPAMAVTPQPARASLEDVLQTMETTYPKSRVGSISLASGPSDVHRISIKAAKESLEVFLNPYSARITGTRSGETVANVIRQTHARFYYFSWQGRIVVGVVGLALLISTVTGLLIYSPFMKHLAFGQIRWRRKLQLIWSDWHKLLGIIALLFNIIIGLTGAVLGLENFQRFSPAAKAALHPAPSAQAKSHKPKNVSGRLTIEAAIAKAQAALPGFEPTSVTLPRAQKTHWMMRGDLKGHFAATGTSWIMLDTHTGAAIEKHDARIARAVTRSYNLSEPLHFGDFAGVPLKIIYCVLGLISSSLYISGFMVWFLKNRHKFRLFPTKHTA